MHTCTLHHGSVSGVRMRERGNISPHIFPVLVVLVVSKVMKDVWWRGVDFPYPSVWLGGDGTEKGVCAGPAER